MHPSRATTPPEQRLKESEAHRRPVIRLDRNASRGWDGSVHREVDVGLDPSWPTVALELRCHVLLAHDSEAMMRELAHRRRLKIVEKFNDCAASLLVAGLTRLTRLPVFRRADTQPLELGLELVRHT